MWVYAGLDPRTGKQRMRTKTFRAKTPAEAKRLGTKAVGSLIDAVAVDKSASGTVAELAREFFEDRKRNWSPTTTRRAKYIVDLIVKDLGSVRLEKLSARQIDAWYATLQKRGMSPANVHHHHRILRSMLTKGERWEMVDSVATRKASPPKVVHHTPTTPSTAGLMAMLNDARGDVRIAVFLLAATGMRRGEVCGIQWRDIDGHKLTVRRSVAEAGQDLTVKSTKSGRERAVSLDDETLSVLAEHASSIAARAKDIGGTITPESFVLPDLRVDRNGRKPRRPAWLTGEWTKLRKRHGSDAVLHSIRHWHATALLDQGRPLPEVSARLGHADTSITARVYAHAIEGSDVGSADVVGELLSTYERG